MLPLVEVLCIKSSNLAELVIGKTGKHILDNEFWNSKNCKKKAEMLLEFQGGWKSAEVQKKNDFHIIMVIIIMVKNDDNDNNGSHKYND